MNTASRLRSSDAAEAVVVTSPDISAIGPATPPSAMAAASHAASARFGQAIGAGSRETRRRIRSTAASPSPAPA